MNVAGLVYGALLTISFFSVTSQFANSPDDDVSNQGAHAHDDSTSTHHCPTRRENLYRASSGASSAPESEQAATHDVAASVVHHYSQMVEIPAGTYQVGNEKPIQQTLLDNETPRRIVTLAEPFFLDKFEVSNAAFQHFVKSTKYRTETEDFGTSFVLFSMVSEETKQQVKQAVAGAQWWILVQNSSWKHPEGVDSSIYRPSLVDAQSQSTQAASSPIGEPALNDTRLLHPVVHVSWNDANAYCAWLGKRLPTELEWEIACRGGLQDRLYAWGNAETPSSTHRMNIWHGEFPLENTRQDGHHATAPVDSFGEQNKFGLFNMIGNVWEWTLDDWIVKQSLNITLHQQELANWQRALRWNAIDKEKATVQKVKKGGSFMCHKAYCYRYRCAARSENTADSSASNLGFRCASSFPV